MGSMAELYQIYDGLQEFCKPPNKLQTGNTFITSSPKWLITWMAMGPCSGLPDGWRCTHARTVTLGVGSLTEHARDGMFHT